MQEYDVIVVGAGTGGAACAKALVEAGVNVLVIEKEALPRYKCCSGVIFGRGQVVVRSVFGSEPPSDVLCAKHSIIRADNCFDWDEAAGFTPHVWEIDKDDQPTTRNWLNVWRDRFDFWLLERSGAPYQHSTRVLGFSADAEHVIVDVKSASGAQEKYRCKYLVGADGTPSAVRRQLAQLGMKTENGYTIAILQSYYHSLSIGKLRKDSWTTLFRPEIADVFCAVHEKDDYLALTVAGYRGQRNLRESMEMLTALLAEKLDVQLGEKWRDEGCQMDMDPPFVGAGRVLLVGDAGGLFCLSGGITSAIDTGYRCGKAVVGALREGGDAVDTYAGSIKDILAHQERSRIELNFMATEPPAH